MWDDYDIFKNMCDDSDICIKIVKSSEMNQSIV